MKNAGSDVRCGAGKRILVGEEDRTLRRMLQAALEAEGYVVETAGNALEVVRLVSLEEREYDTAVLGRCPGVRLRSIVATILACGGARRVVLLLDGVCPDGGPAPGESAGRVALMSRPVDFPALLRHLRSSFESGEEGGDGSGAART